jgi:hypothetical protein
MQKIESFVIIRRVKMTNSTNTIEEQFSAWKTEDAKFSNGNNAAGTRARKALGEMSKAIKLRRNEITAEKNARKESK